MCNLCYSAPVPLGLNYQPDLLPCHFVRDPGLLRQMEIAGIVSPKVSQFSPSRLLEWWLVVQYLIHWGLNTLRLRQNGRHFADDIFKCIFLNENVIILIKISLKFVPNGPINNILALVQIMVWRRPGDKPLSEPMMIRLPQHIHYCDGIMGAMSSQITSLTILYSTVHAGADQRKHQSSAPLALCVEFTGDRWIPRTNGQ